MMFTFKALMRLSILSCLLSGFVCYGTVPVYTKIAHNAHNRMIAIAVGDLCATTIIEYIRVKAMVHSFRPQKDMRPLVPEQHPFLCRTITQLAKKAHIKRPPTYLLEKPGVMNAFVSGINPGLVISSELISVLSADEIEAIIAHEIGHIALRHAGEKLPYRALLGALKYSSVKMLAKSLLTYPNDACMYIAVCEACFYMLGICMFRAYRRYCELRADALAATLTSKPEALIAALKKISPERPKERPKQKEWFVFCKQLSKRLFCTHPSLKTRVNALKAQSRTGN